MNSRERLQLALNHQEADRVPFDLGATVLTSIHHKSYRALRQYLNLPEVEPHIVDIFQQIVTVDDDMRTRLKVDVRDVAPRSSATFRMAWSKPKPASTQTTIKSKVSGRLRKMACLRLLAMYQTIKLGM